MLIFVSEQEVLLYEAVQLVTELDAISRRTAQYAKKLQLCQQILKRLIDKCVKNPAQKVCSRLSDVIKTVRRIKSCINRLAAIDKLESDLLAKRKAGREAANLQSINVRLEQLQKEKLHLRSVVSMLFAQIKFRGA